MGKFLLLIYISHKESIIFLEPVTFTVHVVGLQGLICKISCTINIFEAVCYFICEKLLIVASVIIGLVDIFVLWHTFFFIHVMVHIELFHFLLYNSLIYYGGFLCIFGACIKEFYGRVNLDNIFTNLAF